MRRPCLCWAFVWVTNGADQAKRTLLGGEVGPVEAGYQFGLADIHLTPAGRDDPLFAGLGWSHVQLHHHGEAITTLGEGSGQVRRLLVQAFAKVGLHPECSHDRSWCGEAQFMEQAGVTTDAIERQSQADGGYADYERNSVRLLEGWPCC